VNESRWRGVQEDKSGVRRTTWSDRGEEAGEVKYCRAQGKSSSSNGDIRGRSADNSVLGKSNRLADCGELMDNAAPGQLLPTACLLKQGSGISQLLCASRDGLGVDGR
jgi:hypothetical protein